MMDGHNVDHIYIYIEKFDVETTRLARSRSPNNEQHKKEYIEGLKAEKSKRKIGRQINTKHLAFLVTMSQTTSCYSLLFLHFIISHLTKLYILLCFLLLYIDEDIKRHYYRKKLIKDAESA